MTFAMGRVPTLAPGSLPSDDWVCILVFLVDWVRHPVCVLPAVGGAGSWIHVEAFVEVFTN